MRGEKATKPCATCGRPLTRLVSQARGKFWYCDARCQAAHMPPPGTVSKVPNPYRGQQETRPCVRCGEPVTRYLNPVNVGRQWACSKRCGMLYRSRAAVLDGSWNRPPHKPRRGDTVPCVVCGTPFYRQPVYIKQGRKLCSIACSNIYQTRTPVRKVCARCGLEMVLKPSQSARLYCSRACDTAAKTKRPTGRFHNGRPVLRNFQGYLTVYEPSHPSCNGRHRVLEHRLVMERIVGRILRRDEQVDHINGDKEDNRPENLQVLSPAEHTRKTTADQQRARAKLLAEIAAYREKYGPLDLE